MRHCWLLAAAIGVALMMSACGGSSDSDGTQGSASGNGPAGTVKVGIACDQTTGYASLTAPLVQGIEASAKYANAQNAPTDPDLEIIATDTRSGGTNIANYVAAFKQHIDRDKVSAEYVCLSTAALAYKDQFVSQKVPVIVNQQLSDVPADAQTYFFGGTPLNNAQADIGLSYLKQAAAGRPNPRLAVAVLETGAGTDMVEHVKEVAEQSGFTLASDQVIPLSQTDFRSSASRIMAAKPDALLLYLTSTVLRPLLAQLKATNFQAPTMTVAAQPSDADLKAGSGVTAGLRAWAAPSESKDNEDVRKALANAEEVGTPADVRNEPYFTEGWLVGLAFHAAAKQCSDPCDGAAFQQALESLNLDTGSLGGKVITSSSDHGLQSQVRAYTWDDASGSALPLSGFIDVSSSEYTGKVAGAE